MKLNARTCMIAVMFVSIVLACGCRSAMNEEDVGTLELKNRDFFANAGGRLVFQQLETGGLELRYSLWLQPLRPIRRPMKLEVKFENPEDRSKPLEVAQDIAAGETGVEMTSPPIWGVRPNHDYEIAIRVRDSAGRLLGTQRLLIRSLIDTRGLQRGGS